MVGAINLHKGLSPSSQRPCWAHIKTEPPVRRLCLFAKLLPSGSVLRDWHHIGGLQTLGAILDGKLHFLLGLQLAVAIGLNGGEMHEYILAAIATNKAVALGRIEPLDGSNKTLRHLSQLLLRIKWMPVHLHAFKGESGTLDARLSCLIIHVKILISSLVTRSANSDGTTMETTLLAAFPSE